MSKTSVKKTNLILEGSGDSGRSAPQTTTHGRPEAKQTRRVISPLGMRVVVRIEKDPNVSEGGLYLPEGAKQAASESLLVKVIEVASATDDHSEEETNVSGIPLGAFVLIPKAVGVRVPWNDDLRIVDTKDVLAIVHEISVI